MIGVLCTDFYLHGINRFPLILLYHRKNIFTMIFSCFNACGGLWKRRFDWLRTVGQGLAPAAVVAISLSRRRQATALRYFHFMSITEPPLKNDTPDICKTHLSGVLLDFNMFRIIRGWLSDRTADYKRLEINSTRILNKSVKNTFKTRRVLYSQVTVIVSLSTTLPSLSTRTAESSIVPCDFAST